MIGAILALVLIVLIMVFSFLLPTYVMEEAPKRRRARRKSDPVAAAIRRLGS